MPSERPMSRFRFRTQTIMIVIAALAVLMGLPRSPRHLVTPVVLTTFAVLASVAIFLASVVVEFILVKVYSWFLQKRWRRFLKRPIAHCDRPNLDRSGEAVRV
jgi:hypothetical protein